MKNIIYMLFAFGMGHSVYGVSKNPIAKEIAELEALKKQIIDDDQITEGQKKAHLERIAEFGKRARGAIQRGQAYENQVKWTCTEELSHDLFMDLLKRGDLHADKMLVNIRGHFNPQDKTIGALLQAMDEQQSAQGQIIFLNHTKEHGTKKQKTAISNAFEQTKQEITKSMFSNMNKIQLGHDERFLEWVKFFIGNRNAGKAKQEYEQVKDYDVKAMSGYLAENAHKQTAQIAAMQAIKETLYGKMTQDDVRQVRIMMDNRGALSHQKAKELGKKMHEMVVIAHGQKHNPQE